MPFVNRPRLSTGFRTLGPLATALLLAICSHAASPVDAPARSVKDLKLRVSANGRYFVDQEGKRVLAVRCERGPKAAFVKDGQLQRFYVRGGNSTAELQGPAITDYVKQRFD